MKKENKLIKPIFVTLLVLVGLMGLALFLRFNPGAFGETQTIPYSPQVHGDVKEALGITVPQEAEYIKGYTVTGLNTVHIWIWNLQRTEGESAEAAIRRSFNLAELCKAGTTPMNPAHHDPIAKLLNQEGYPFTTKIFFQTGTSEIQFRELEDGTVQAALIHKTA